MVFLSFSSLSLVFSHYHPASLTPVLANGAEWDNFRLIKAEPQCRLLTLSELCLIHSGGNSSQRNRQQTAVFLNIQLLISDSHVFTIYVTMENITRSRDVHSNAICQLMEFRLSGEVLDMTTNKSIKFYDLVMSLPSGSVNGTPLGICIFMSIFFHI